MGWYAIRVVPREGSGELLEKLRSALSVEAEATVELSGRPTILLVRTPRLSAALVEAILKAPKVVGFANHPPRALREAEFHELRPLEAKENELLFEEGVGEIDQSTIRVLNGPSWARSQRRVAALLLIFAAALFAAYWTTHGG